VSPGGATSEIFAPGVLQGRVALVTGGGSGLGLATARELHRCGAAVAICRRQEVLERAAATIAGDRGASDGVSWHAGDVRDPDSARQTVSAVLERHGGLDLLVNNAGGQFFSPAELIAAKGWRAVWRLNTEGMLNMSAAARELAMRARGGGSIVNVTLSPHHGMPGMAHSGAARAAVEALTIELARRWAGDGIAVCALAAGHFDTEVLAKYPAGVRAGAGRTVPLGRLGEPLEHAWLVTLLATPLGRALSGATLTLDGGRDNWFGPWPPPGLADESGQVPVEERAVR
jgi:citronellol/citronellal dehydrogenase